MRMTTYIEGDAVLFIAWWQWLFLWIVPKTTTVEYVDGIRTELVVKRLLGKTYILNWRTRRRKNDKTRRTS